VATFNSHLELPFYFVPFFTAKHTKKETQRARRNDSSRDRKGKEKIKKKKIQITPQSIGAKFKIRDQKLPTSDF